MVAQITERRFVDGRWFNPPQQYSFVQEYIVPASFFYNVCEVKCQQAGVTAYDVLVGDVVFTIPSEIASIINKETPDTDMTPAVQRWDRYATKDIAAPVSGGHTDVVVQAEIFMGINIRQGSNNIQVDGNRLRALNAEKERRANRHH